MMRIIIFCVLMTVVNSLAGMYWLMDANGSVTRHEGDTPYPPGAAYRSDVPRNTPVEYLTIVDGVVRRKSIADINAARQAAKPLPLFLGDLDGMDAVIANLSESPNLIRETLFDFNAVGLLLDDNRVGC